ncbi:hypothetical protein HID58_018069 [Brassica napus]|uniref:Uncharacterized protein n=1 Tax=Brassica napus TaxID=3708 RepID=A0ABQ8D8X0_BRANA|nr:hypothetical protein HID58_018069 [Brassica napus]
MVLGESLSLPSPPFLHCQSFVFLLPSVGDEAVWSYSPIFRLAAPPPLFKFACSDFGRPETSSVGGELMKVDMLLLNSQATMLPAKLTMLHVHEAHRAVEMHLSETMHHLALEIIGVGKKKLYAAKVELQGVAGVQSYFDRSIITRLYDEQQQYRQKPENREQQKLKSLKRNRDKTGSHILIGDHPHNDSEI